MAEFGSELIPSRNDPEGKEGIFDSLALSEKVRAVLAAVREPVSRDFALNLAGIELEALSPDQAHAVEAVFDSPDTDESSGEYGSSYRLSETARSLVDKDVLGAANHRITESLWEGFTEDFGRV